MNVPLIASVVSAVILVSGLFISWLLTLPDKAPEPEPAHVGQIRKLELAFPVGKAFEYMGCAMYPYSYWRVFRDGPYSVGCKAELRCEYRDDNGVIHTHTLTYAQAMAIAAANGYKA